MKELEKALGNLPDGVFICEDGIYKIINGQVIKQTDCNQTQPSAKSNIITNDDDPKAGGN